MLGVQAEGQAESPSRMTFLPEPGSKICMTPSPPMPHIIGSTTLCVSAQATTASSALPLAASTRSPASTASGCGATIIALDLGRRRFGFGIAASVKLAGEGFGRAVDIGGPGLAFFWHLQNTVGGMSADDIVGDSEVVLGDRAMPNLMAALSRPHKSTAGVFQKSNEPPIESRDHSARDHRHLVRGEVDRYRLAAFG